MFSLLMMFGGSWLPSISMEIAGYLCCRAYGMYKPSMTRPIRQAKGEMFTTPEGYPQGLCKAKKFYYVTTSGGYIGEFDFGFQYARAVVTNLYGIPEAECIKKEGLDIV